MAENTVPALADLDLDGTMDIVVPAVDGNLLYRLTDKGDVIWRVTLPDPATAGVTLGDVDRNGTLDILVAAGTTLLCYNADGKERWHVDLSEEINSFPTIADIDGDSRPEVLFGANDNKLHVLTSQGKAKWTFPTKSWIVGGVAVGDLGGDEKLEIVFGSMDFYVYCLDSKGKLRWKYKTRDWVQSSPCIADVDRDGGSDILISSDDGHLYCLSRRGTLKWRGVLSGSQRMKPYLAVADLDGEGTLETVVGLPNGAVQAYTAFGDRAWSSYVSGGVVGSPLIADLNGDSWQDILVATQGGQLVALNTWGGWHWSHSVGQTIESTPLLSDLDRDGKYEIYVANLMRSSQDSGFFSQYEISTKGGKGPWPTLKGDPYRTGAAANARDYGGVLRRGGDYATAWEPFRAGYRPRTRIQPPRRLRITALPLDDVKGNHDGALDPGETALFKVRVVNEGKGASYDSTLTVSLDNSILKLDRTRMYLGWIAPKAAKTAVFRLTAPPLIQIIQRLQQPAPFREIANDEDTDKAVEPSPGKMPTVRVRPAQIVAKWQTAKMQVTETGVLAAVSTARVFNVPPLPPVLRVLRWQLIDSAGKLTFGNGNGRLDSGETVVLRLMLHNANLTTAKSATARLSSGSRDVLVATPMAMMRDIVPFGGRQVNFSLRIARRLQGNSITLKLMTQAAIARAGLAPPHTETITLPLRQGPIDAIAPSLVLTSPASRIATTNQARIVIAGMVADASNITAFRFDKQPVPVAKLKRSGPNRYRFWFDRALKVGENVFPINATDTAGNSITLWVRVVRKPSRQPQVTQSQVTHKKPVVRPLARPARATRGTGVLSLPPPPARAR